MSDFADDESDEQPADGAQGQLSEVERLDPAAADTPVVDGDATAGYPTSESGEAQEPQPEAGPNANPHRDQETGRGSS